MSKIYEITIKLLVLLMISSSVYAQDEAVKEEITKEEITNKEEFVLAYKKYKDSIDNLLNYQTGVVDLGDGLAALNVPIGYKFINAKEADFVLTDLWGNPSSADQGLLGMLLKEDESPIEITYAIEISYSEEGYIEDGDADDIDYDELLETMQSDAKDSNPQRTEQGYPTIELLGWASAPFYDKEHKKLHWAKELQFGEEEEKTLNYNIRILGRKGYINLNVIGTMDVLTDVKTNLDTILTSVHFNEGYKYENFDSSIDEVAAYGIGGLIAGKLLAKVGFFALILKFWKFIAIGIGGAYMAFKKRLFGKKESE